MLPQPVGSRYQRRIRVNPTSPRQRFLDSLTRRSRITNLGACLLSALCTISVLINIQNWLSSTCSPNIHYHELQLETVQRPEENQDLTHLVVVPCHSIWKGTDSWSNEDDWLLESYQRGPGRVKAFYEHILKGVELVENDPNALLIFSGGQTKSVSSTTEAESYLRLAKAAGILPDGNALSSSAPFGRATTENYALDSYQNLLFSISRFHEYTGCFPSQITIVGYEFKRARFEELHRTAIRWPKHLFNYLGVDPDHSYASNSRAIQGERQNGYIPYTLDRYGCHTMLIDKRRQRNRHARFHPYDTSVPELVPLLDWCPGESQSGTNTLFEGDLPWDHVTHRRESS
ncbi:hypothetical protein CPB83DRAFT_313950 [Crepidotus variabilis]|uniref:DUF218 domain-containing protein n=1 Tax=Crepidotus variabilis TaxID=179855 RepID=A0A9P6EG96_9AGAR|nr:hypothetical protein CPB83DRAFT_313950 [Crepidotus variabilis]